LHPKSKEHLIRRYEHNCFSGWVVAAKRRGRRWTRYFSDNPDGAAVALRRARHWRAQLLATLPAVTKTKRTYVLNRTGVIGVARLKEKTRAGRTLCGTWRNGRGAMEAGVRRPFRSPITVRQKLAA